MAAKTMPAKPSRFSYVFIPADNNQPMEEREFDQVDLEDDKFIKMLKEYFAVASPEASVDREMLLQQMSGHAKREIKESLDAETIERLLATTSIDILTISLPSAANNFVGVSLYCDDKGKSKNLPLNSRTAGLVEACGMAGHLFHGDIFLSRMYDDGEDDWFRMSFPMSDVSSSAEWVTRTAAQAAQRASSGPTSLSGLADQFFTRTGGAQAPVVIGDSASQPQANVSGETEAYKWYQTADDVEITINTSESLTKSQIAVAILPKRLKVTIAGTVIIEGDLIDSIDCDDSTWTYSAKDNLLQVTLVKKSPKMWDSVFKQ